MTSNIKNGIYKDYYDNGAVMRERQYKDGKRHGMEISYFRNGRINMELPYKNGRFHGELRIYDADGTPILSQFWLYGNSTTEEEYKKYVLIERLSEIK